MPIRRRRKEMPRPQDDPDDVLDRIIARPKFRRQRLDQFVVRRAGFAHKPPIELPAYMLGGGRLLKDDPQNIVPPPHTGLTKEGLRTAIAEIFLIDKVVGAVEQIVAT